MPRSLSERLTGRVVLTLGEQQWPVLFSHDALLEIEESSGKSVLAGEVNLFQPSASVMRTVVTVMLGRAGCKDPAAIRGLLHPVRRVTTQTVLIKAWRAAMPEAEASTSKKEPGSLVWLDIWADNRQHLNVTDDEWLAMTPRMVQALSRERLDLMRQQEWMLAGIRAAVMNYSNRAPKEMAEIGDLMLHPYPKKETDANREMIGKMQRYAALFKESAA